MRRVALAALGLHLHATNVSDGTVSASAGSASLRNLAAGIVKLTIHPHSPALRLLKALKSLKLTILVRFTSIAGRSSSATVKLIVSRQR